MFGRKSGNKKELTKEKKKYTTGKYGKTSFKHSSMGKNSCWFAIVSLGLILTAVLIAYVMRGNTISAVGGLGILSLVTAGLGIRAAMKGFRERERKYITCRIGIALNGIILLGLIIIFFRGVL